jgi:hypothetical protein
MGHRDLVISDEESPFALRSTEIVRGQQCTGGACRLWSRAVGTTASAFVPQTTTQGLARDLPETALRAASRRPTTRPSTAPLTCADVWRRQVVYGVASHPRIDGMQGLRGQVSSTAADQWLVEDRGGIAASSQAAGMPQVMRVAPTKMGKPILAAIRPADPPQVDRQRCLSMGRPRWRRPPMERLHERVSSSRETHGAGGLATRAEVAPIRIALNLVPRTPHLRQSVVPWPAAVGQPPMVCCNR